MTILNENSCYAVQIHIIAPLFTLVLNLLFNKCIDYTSYVFLYVFIIYYIYHFFSMGKGYALVSSSRLGTISYFLDCECRISLISSTHFFHFFFYIYTQLDFAVTISALLGLPFPFGRYISEL